MSTPIYTCLGFVTEMRFVDKDGDEFDLSFKPKNSWSLTTGKNSYLMIAKGKKEIILIPWKKPKNALVPSGGAAQKKLYSDWSGYDNTEAYRTNLPKAKLLLIGRITGIEYTSDKFERKGDRPGKFNLWKHKFRVKQKLYANKANTIFAIRSNKTLFNYRGIIG